MSNPMTPVVHSVPESITENLSASLDLHIPASTIRSMWAAVNDVGLAFDFVFDFFANLKP